MELSNEDYREIEQNLKYKKGRAQTLALLRKQSNQNLTACIERLLEDKSEECHMGALDLALQLKKDDENSVPFPIRPEKNRYFWRNLSVRKVKRRIF